MSDPEDNPGPEEDPEDPMDPDEEGPEPPEPADPNPQPEDDFPDYANQANKELNEVIKQKRGFISGISEEIEEIQERVKVLRDHLKNVQAELINTQNLVDSKNREIETEDHLKQLAERQTGRLYSELQKLDQKAAEQQDRLNTVQTLIFKGNEKLDQFKLQMNWNQEELEQWALASRQKEEDNLTLEKYRRADEAKIKELAHHIENLTMEVRRKQQELDREVTETQAKQIELDKTAEEFRRAHQERHELFEQVREMDNQVNRRNEEIRSAAEQAEADKNRIAEKREKCNQRIRFLAEQQADNKRTESKIELQNRKLGNIRMKHIEMAEMRGTKVEEVGIERNQLSALASKLSSKRSKIISLNQLIADKRQRLEAIEKRRTAIEEQLEAEKNQAMTLEERARRAEEEFLKCQRESEALERTIQDHKTELFKKTQELFKLREDEASLIGKISGSMAQGRNIQSAISKLEQEVQRQEVLLYSADYNIQNMERRVEQAKGVRTTEQHKVIIAETEVKEKELTEMERNLSTMMKAVGRLVDELRTVERTLLKTKTEESDLKSNLDELNLEIKMTEAAVERLLKEKENILVQHDVMKLEVKKLRDNLMQEIDKLFTAENRKNQLQMSMEEREKEINVHKEILMAERRATEEEKHKVMVELADRKSKVQNLRVKYENLCMKNKARDDDGEDRTQAYYVIKAAQAREELQRYGDELDAKIKKSEREIRALSNTLEHLKGRNSRFRDSFLPKGDASEREAKDALEDQCRGASEQLFRKRKELQNLQNQIESESRRLNELEAQMSLYDKQLTDLAQQRQALDERVAQQVDKLSRAQKAAASKSIELTSAADLEIKLNLEQQKFRVLLTGLTQLSSELPELGQLLEPLLAAKGVQLPSRPPSVASSGSRDSFM